VWREDRRPEDVKSNNTLLLVVSKTGGIVYKKNKPVTTRVKNTITIGMITSI